MCRDNAVSEIPRGGEVGADRVRGAVQGVRRVLGDKARAVIGTGVDQPDVIGHDIGLCCKGIDGLVEFKAGAGIGEE